MASTMNSGGSIDLNRIKIDPRTGEKFSFNLDKVAATAWYGQEASRFKVKSMVSRMNSGGSKTALELSHGRARN